MRILGMMSGTSSDGLDGACLEITGHSLDQWRLLWVSSENYPKSLKKQVLDLQKPGAKISLRSLLDLHRDLGIWYGKTARRWIEQSPVQARPDVISNHGQTVAHFPTQKGGKPGTGMTLQLGEGFRIARETGLTCVQNLREADLAWNGQGAPLVPKFHELLARGVGHDRGVSIHNLGGISNLSYFGPGGKIFAFDSGPGNILIDESVRVISKGKKQFDLDGKIAAAGMADDTELKKLLAHPYFRLSPPKSTGRDDFTWMAFKKKTRARGAHLVRTATEYTVQSIAQTYQRQILGQGYPLKTVFFCGGGTKNSFLMGRLREVLAPLSVQTTFELGLDPLFVEAAAFAYFGALSLKAHSIGGSWTGASPGAPGGHLLPGRNWNQILALLPK